MRTIPPRRPPLPAYGFFGGSFDPIQKGHIALAQAALRERKLARVYLVPAAQSPLKNDRPRASLKERASLIRKAIRGKSGLSLGRWEMDRPGPSFTFRTLRQLRHQYPRRRWELIMGEDSWAHFHRWRRWREIAEHHRVIIGKRTGPQRAIVRGEAVYLKTALPTVSSTDVRRAMSQGRNVSRWLDPAVAQTINKKGLYL
ncbi:MAG: nicotinate (nicotinamide) nucleotide adenylyltransferase [Elusimicrobia bacterium]|nr:nicotinate (nicotinamide) nucleotide adenylyltransferase [Elusimicrobiota bacterium]